MSRIPLLFDPIQTDDVEADQQKQEVSELNTTPRKPIHACARPPTPAFDDRTQRPAHIRSGPQLGMPVTIQKTQKTIFYISWPIGPFRPIRSLRTGQDKADRDEARHSK